jgi:hypothetical protein
MQLRRKASQIGHKLLELNMQFVAFVLQLEHV